MSSLEYPRLRALEAFPHYQDGRTLVVLRDPAQVSDQMLVVSPELVEMFPLLNGKNSVREIQVELSRRQGRIVFVEDLARILKHLDEAYFLDNSNFRSHQERVVEEFRAASVRRARHAGGAYPSELLDLSEKLNGFYMHPEGAGLPATSVGRNVKAVVAPHIDLRSGGPCYTHAYRALAESAPPDLFVILGTGHMGLPEMFSISSKTFETPLGSSPVDMEFVATFKEHLGEDLFQEDLSHRHEHTIEFQLVFLHHILAGRTVPILPILCSFSYRDLVGQVRSEEAVRWFERFVASFRKTEELLRRRVCIISSVDFAHIGPRYGDNFAPDSSTISRTSAIDTEMLEPLCAGDPDQFLSFIAKEEDGRRICGFPVLYTMLRLRPGLKGRLLDHKHTVMDEGGSFVTYGSLIFE